MSTTRKAKKARFTVVANDLLDSKMSVLARFVLVYYLSKPDGWHISNEYLEQIFPEYGRVSVTRAVNELIDNGYYKRVRYQNERGHWMTVVHLTESPFDFEDDPEAVQGDVGQDLLDPDDDRATVGSRGAGSPTVRSRGVRETAGKRVRTRQEELVSYESAGAESEGRPMLRSVSPVTNRQPRKRSGARRVDVPTDSPLDTGQVVGMRGTTDKAVRARARRQTIARPDSGGGLAAEFGQRATEAGLSGPQQVNGAALARSLTAWTQHDTNPDTPAGVRSMFDAFFESPGGSEDYPLWRRFLQEAPRLRNAGRKSEPVDYAAARENDREWLEAAAARGDIRAEKALSGENMPWMQDWKTAESR